MIPCPSDSNQRPMATPSAQKCITAKLLEANNIYDLPSIEQAIRWMHAVCGNPVKSTWLKAVKAGNFIGWPLLTEKNIEKYFPDTPEIQQGHMAQTRKNVRSTKHLSQDLHHPMLLPSRARRHATSTLPSTMFVKLPFPTKLGISLHNHNEATNTSWSWSRLTAMPFSSSP